MTTAGSRRADDRRNTAALVGFSSVTNLADGVTKVVLPLLATRLTHSPALVAGVALSLTLPWLLTALHIGALVDRRDRRRMMIEANAVRLASVLGLLAAVLTGTVSIPVLYLAGTALGVAEVVALTASAALVPAAVSPAGRDRVNSWMTAAETVCNEFCGPFVGGVLVAVGYAFALGSSLAAFALTLLIPLLLVGRFRPEPVAGRQAPGTGVTDGLRFLWHQPLLRAMALILTVLCLCWGAWLALIPLVVVSGTAAGPLGFGLILGSLGLGGLAGAAATMPLNRIFGRRRVLFADVLGTFAMVSGPLLTANPWVLAGSAFLGGMGGTLWSVNARTLSQRLVPAELMGRFHAAWRLLSWGAMPVGAAVVGLLGELIGLRAAFAPFALITAALLIPFFRVMTPQAVAAAEASELNPLQEIPLQEKGTSMPDTASTRLDQALARHVRGPVDDDTDLVRLGLDSLTLVRIIVHAVGEDSEQEIDLGRLERLRTVADLRAWLAGTAVPS